MKDKNFKFRHPSDSTVFVIFIEIQPVNSQFGNAKDK